MAWINITAWTQPQIDALKMSITQSIAHTSGIVVNEVVPTGFVNDVPMGWQRVIVRQSDRTTRTDYRGMTLASANALAAFIGNDVQTAGSQILYTRMCSVNRANDADGFTVSVVEVNSAFSTSSVAP